MARIVIYDKDLKGAMRYSLLAENKNHHVTVRLMSQIPAQDVEKLKKEGFDEVHCSFGDPRKEEADAYFVDDLCGDCFTLMEKLPKLQSYINQSMYSPRNVSSEAKERGHNMMIYRLEFAVEEALRNKP